MLTLGQVTQSSKPPSQPEQAETMVRSLYTEVVARHPIGIPGDADMKTFAQYLSKSLLHRIDLATACGKDWYRQNPDPNLKPEFDWLEFGLFAGGNEKASPRTFHVERTRSEKDGSYRVYVKLTWGLAPKPWIWRVAAVVVKESGHPVIDDVIFLKDGALDPEFRLSEVLTEGCDDRRWVGRRNHRSDLKWSDWDNSKNNWWAAQDSNLQPADDSRNAM
jgi:hypothetical protein